MSDWFTVNNHTTTVSDPSSVLLTLRRDGDGYIVTDCVGTLYGAGSTPRKALADWGKALDGFLDIVAKQPCAARLRLEAARYEAALRRTPQ